MPAGQPATAVEAPPPAPPRPGTGAPPVAVRLDVPAWGSGTGLPDWSYENLQRLGLPAPVLDAIRAQEPRDDLGWLHAVGRAVTALCRPLPAGEAVIVGPKAKRLAEGLGVGLAALNDRPPRGGSFAAAVRDSDANRTWLAWARGHRWLHIVVGGTGWRDFLFDEPMAISWTAADDLPQALQLAADLGMVLGYQPTSGREAPRRANPVDIAVAVRELLPTR